MSEEVRRGGSHRWIPIFANREADVPKPKEAPSLPAPETGWFGRHVPYQGGGIIALVAPPPEPMEPVEDVWFFTGKVLVMVQTSTPGRSSLHLRYIRAALESAVFTAERLGEDHVERVTAAALYERPRTGERLFSPVTQLDDMRG